jgi:protein TonB
MYISRNYSAKSLPVCMVCLALLGAAVWAQDPPRKITRAEAMAAVVTKVQPEYPAIARQLKMQGAVELDVTVAENGDVTKVEILKGNPVLTAPAVQAVKRWKFKPFVEDGKAACVLAPIELDFKL